MSLQQFDRNFHLQNSIYPELLDHFDKTSSSVNELLCLVLNITFVKKLCRKREVEKNKIR